MNYLIYSYLYFVNREIGYQKFIDPDIPIEKQFDDRFDEFSLIIASVKFEMNHAVEIPDEYMDYTQTLRQLAVRISQLPRIDDKDYGNFLMNKCNMLQLGLKMFQGLMKSEEQPN